MLASTTPEWRLEALALAEPAEVIALADALLETFDVRVVRGPTVGSLMIRIEEPVEGLPFNFTEVTATEAEVTAGEHRGYAMVLGIAPERAVAAAVLDAAVAAEHPLAERVVALLHAALERDAAQWQERWADVAPTRVRFEESTR